MYQESIDFFQRFPLKNCKKAHVAASESLMQLLGRVSSADLW